MKSPSLKKMESKNFSFKSYFTGKQGKVRKTWVFLLSNELKPYFLFKFLLITK